MNIDQIKAIQTKIGTEPDGHFGPKSITAAVEYLISKMPKPNPWPGTSQKQLREFYGEPGDESNIVHLDVSPDLGIRYDGSLVTRIRCHKKVAESLHRILVKVATSIYKEILAEYAGCFNDRPMRGGTLPSLHAWGAAIDLHPDGNENKTHWPDAAIMPLEVMEIFAEEGWTSAGVFWSRDAMHMQATDPQK